MDLLKYLEPMKNIPDRFSNLAFWRGVRKLRDEVVNAFEYVDSWGENIEHKLDNLPTRKLVNVATIPTFSIQADDSGVRQIGATEYGFYLTNNGRFEICTLPPNAIGVTVTCHISYSVGSNNYVISPIGYNLYSIANGKLWGRWTGNNAVFYDPVLTPANYANFTNGYLTYDVVFSLSE